MNFEAVMVQKMKNIPLNCWYDSVAGKIPTKQGEMGCHNLETQPP